MTTSADRIRSIETTSFKELLPMKISFTRIFATTLVAMTISATNLALADAPKGPEPTPELKDFGKFFIGTWKCDANWNASPMGPAHPAKASVVIKAANGGFWIAANYKEEKTKQNPAPLDATEIFGHDGKKFIRLAVDNFGGAMLATTPAWEGDKLTFKGDLMMMGGVKAPGSIAYTKKGPKELTFGVVATGPDGKPADLAGGTCKK